MNTETSIKSSQPAFATHGYAELTPRELGYHFPPEFGLHVATWLSWPHKEESWPGKIDTIFPSYVQFIKELTKGEVVRINVESKMMQQFALLHLESLRVDLGKVEFYLNPTNDAWCRDHGPSFLINPRAEHKKIIVDWDYNAWGNKYPPFDLDDEIPSRIGKEFNTPVFKPGIVMEGGAIDVNGAGTLITSTCCLMNPNRNSGLSQQQIEEYLINYYGVNQVLWIDEGIKGDDTDGHIDSTVRFVNHDTVLAVVEENTEDENYYALQNNLKKLQSMHLLNGHPLNIIELPMPDPVYWQDQRLPASYANFYIANKSVIVPTFNCEKDEAALQIIQGCFPGRKVVGIDSTEIIWGLGSFHCLCQQEPAV